MIIGQSVERKDAYEKVTGNAKYTLDEIKVGTLYARIATSKVAHANIKNINKEEASKVEGVLSIITGKDVPVLYGVLLRDRPVIAIDKVRYFRRSCCCNSCHK